MARVRQPLHSMTATGGIGAALQFQRASAKQTARYAPKSVMSRASADPTPAQATQRAHYAGCAAAWAALSQPERDSWVAAATAARITAYNAYLSACLLAPAGVVWDAATTTWDAGTTAWPT